MRKQLYCQCLMRHQNTYRVGWIPNEFAEKNRIIDLKINNKWSKGWTVVSPGIKVSEEYVMAREMDYKKQRKASDI